MRYLLLSTNDYASLSARYADALESVGVTAHAFTLSPHPFLYQNQAILVNAAYVKSIYKGYDKVIILHSCPYILSLVRDHPFLIVGHTGTLYRDNPELSNETFNSFVKCSITDQTEFMHLGAKNLSYIAPHTTYTRVPKRDTGKLIIGHYPSNADVKGTWQIVQMLEPFRDYYEIRVDTSLIPHEENVKRMQACHIYIELFKPTLNGKDYGCFGVTAFESAGLGCMTITQNLHPGVYYEAYGPTCFHLANTKEDFHRILETHKTLRAEDYHMIQTPDTFYQKHSLHATGHRLIQITQ